MSLYKYVSCENAMRILNGSIRMTQPSEFNDPFELAVELFVSPDTKDAIYNFQFDILSPRESLGSNMLPDDFESDFCHDMGIREIREELDKSIGILCLSKRNDSHLMWAHYANNYSGVVLEFDKEHEFFEGQMDMEYREKRLKINFDYFIKREKEIPLSALFVKPKIWEYENEVRITRNLKGLKKAKNPKGKLPIYLDDIPIECIKSVTLGERTKSNEALSIFNKIKNTNIELKLAAIPMRGYDFRYELIKANLPVSKLNPLVSPRTADIFKNEKFALGEVSRWMISSHPMRKIVSKTL